MLLWTLHTDKKRIKLGPRIRIFSEADIKYLLLSFVISIV